MALRVHHLNCGTCCPIGGRLFDGHSHGALARIVGHCLLIESAAGLVLVDTGFGTKDIARHERLPLMFRMMNNIQFIPEETALAQIRRLGFAPEDVRHILITHLDFDHAGGLEDFPNATVHMTAREKEVADARNGGFVVGTRRYQPGQWNEVGQWKLYPMGTGERWNELDCVRSLEGLPPEILLLPLPGHTWGHSGIAVDTGSGWLLHAGDAYFHSREMDREPHCPPGLRGYQRLMEVDRTARLRNQQRLRDLKERMTGLTLFCAHDAAEFEALAKIRPPIGQSNDFN